jgi:molybdenum-dependent DNA-binding transcriptional regulator ModE
VSWPKRTGGAPQGLELRHLRYFVALADTGSFTHAAERIFVAQPTLSQQIRRLEEIIGTPLLQRRREGLRLTTAGAVLLDASRDVLSLVDHGMSRTRQAAGLGRQRLRVVVPPSLPETLGVAGVGCGLALLGANRTLIALATPGQRAGLIAAIFIVNFLGLSVPVLIAGMATAHFGLYRTALAYCVAMAALIAVAAGSLLLRGRGSATGQ